MKYGLFFTFILCIFFQHAYANEKRDEVIKLIDEELTEVSRLNKSTGSSNPDFMLRLVELLLEKGRLLREIENEGFLQIPNEKRTAALQKTHFERSEKYYLKSKELCVFIIKKFPHYKKIANVYFTLGYFDKEHLNFKSAKKHFIEVVKLAQKDDSIKAKSFSVLGEIAYIEKEFNECIDFYNKSLALKDSDNRWKTKDIYNLSWCYYREKKIDVAITKLEEVLKLSKNNEYVDLSSQASRDIGLFLAQAGRTNEAIVYYQKNGGDVLENLSKVVDGMISQGKLAIAEEVAKVLLKQAGDDFVYKKKALLYLLNIHNKAEKLEEHLAIATTLVNEKEKFNFDTAEKEELQFQIDKYCAILQKSVLNIHIQNKDKIRNKRTRIAVEYFKLRSILNPATDYKSHLAAAETLYANKSYNTAADHYVLAMNRAKELGDKEITKIAFNGLAACLSQNVIRQEIKDKYLVEVFKAQISDAPKSDKANKAYQRLFTEYLKKEQIDEADKLILDYSKSFPAESATTEALIGKIIDTYRIKGNVSAVEKWQTAVSDKGLKVSDKFAEKFNKIVLGTKFEKAEKALEEGDKKTALSEYFKIYKDEKSNRDSKTNAAYNIAIIYYGYGDLEQIKYWTQQTLQLTSDEQLKKLHLEISKLALLLFNRKNLDSSSAIYAQLFQRDCKDKSVTSQGYLKNAFTIFLALNSHKDAKTLYNNAKTCGVDPKIMSDLQSDLLRFYFEEQMTDLAYSFAGQEKLIEKNNEASLYFYGKLYEAYQHENVDKAEKLKQLFLRNWNIKKIKNINAGRETLDLVADFYLEDLKVDMKHIKAFKLEFPQEKYNTLLKKYLKEIEALANSVQLVLELKSGHGATSAYNIMIDAYSSAVDKIDSFTPENKPQDYVEAFHKSMKGVTNVLREQAREVKSVAVKIVQDQSLLTESTREIIGSNETFVPRYVDFMRLGGKR